MLRLVRNNYRHVPFSAEHLNARLDELVKRGEGAPLRLQSDETLGVFLRQFGDLQISDESLVGVTMQWWSSLITSPTFAQVRGR